MASPIENNIFTHLEEGFHVLCYAGTICTGVSAPTWNNFIVRWNDFNNIHRIATEMQPQNASNVTLAFNSYENAFAPSTFTMGFSAGVLRRHQRRHCALRQPQCPAGEHQRGGQVHRLCHRVVGQRCAGE